MRRSLLLAAICTGCTGGDTSTADDTDTAPLGPVELAGGAQKGPMILGSTVSIVAIDDAGAPTGAVFPTAIQSDRGDFTVTVAHRGLVRIEATGFWFNEVSNDLSVAPISLDAWADLSPVAPAPVFVNLVTHLSAGRVATLLESGTPFDDAVAQAERELRAGLSIGTNGLDPGAGGTAMDITGGDTLSNAYAFAVSAVLLQVVTDESDGNTFDADFQQLLNTIASDLATDGTLASDLTTRIDSAQGRVHLRDVEANLSQRLVDVGLSGEVPDLSRVIDSDLDGVADADDPCGVGEICLGATTEVVIPGRDDAVRIADMDNDGIPDVVVLDEMEGFLRIVFGDGAGGFREDITEVDLGGGVSGLVLGDLDDDGAPEVVTHLSDLVPGSLLVLPNTGTGTFGSPDEYPLDAECTPWCEASAILQSDGGFADLAMLVHGGSGDDPSIRLWHGDGSGALVPALGNTVAAGMERLDPVGDIDGDGDPDLLATNAQWGGLHLYLNDGAGTFVGQASLPLTEASGSACGANAWVASAADIDGDGDVDLWGHVRDTCTHETVGVEWLADGASWTTVTTDVLGDQVSVWGLMDFDADANFESLILSGGDARLLDVRDDGTFELSAPRVMLEQQILRGFADFDGDDRVDLVATFVRDAETGTETSVRILGDH